MLSVLIKIEILQDSSISVFLSVSLSVVLDDVQRHQVVALFGVGLIGVERHWMALSKLVWSSLPADTYVVAKQTSISQCKTVSFSEGPLHNAVLHQIWPGDRPYFEQKRMMKTICFTGLMHNATQGPFWMILRKLFGLVLTNSGRYLLYIAPIMASVGFPAQHCSVPHLKSNGDTSMFQHLPALLQVRTTIQCRWYLSLIAAWRHGRFSTSSTLSSTFASKYHMHIVYAVHKVPQPWFFYDNTNGDCTVLHHCAGDVCQNKDRWSFSVFEFRAIWLFVDPVCSKILGCALVCEKNLDQNNIL